MPKSFKLPRRRWQELSDIASKKIPRWPRPGHVLCDNVHDEVHDAIDAQRRRKGATLSPARRDWALLNDLGSALMGDGAVVGILNNLPALITPGLALMNKLGMPKTAAMLRTMKALLPPPRITSRGPAAHWAWLEDPQHTDPNSLQRLEALSDRCELYKNGWAEPAIRMVLKSPAEFFDDEDGTGFEL